MPKLPKENIGATDALGEQYEFCSEVSVDTSGVFHMTFPDELAEYARSYVKDKGGVISGAFDVTRARKFYRLSGRDLRKLREHLNAIVEEFVRGDVTKTPVIRYKLALNITYWRGADGKLYPNGHMAHHVLGGPNGAWADDVSKLHACNTTDAFVVGLYAQVLTKITVTRPSGTKVTFERFQSTDDHFNTDSWADKLNAFCGLDTDFSGDDDSIQEMPYTEEAARFFYEMMLQLCYLAERLHGFFKDKKQLEFAIQKRILLLGGG